MTWVDGWPVVGEVSTEVAGGFTGRIVGMYAAAGTVRFDWFDYEPLE